MPADIWTIPTITRTTPRRQSMVTVLDARHGVFGGKFRAQPSRQGLRGTGGLNMD
jgi:hypothetical protein